MRVSTFFKSSTVAIVVFIVTFIITLYWVTTTYHNSRVQNNDYQSLKSQVSIEFHQVISKYLQTGDATLLINAENSLTKISAQIKAIKLIVIAENISQQVKVLQQLLSTKFRALGKLSGDPSALLRNSEQGMNALNHQLANYAKTSEKLTNLQKIDYLEINEKIADELVILINTREKVLLNKAAIKSIELALNDLTTSSQQLLSFPLLAIFEQNDESDELTFYDDNDEKTDLSEDTLNELLSIIKRYESDFTLSLHEINNKNKGLQSLSNEVTKLENYIQQGELTVIRQQQETDQKIQTIIIGLVIYLLVFLFFNHYLQHRIILKPLQLLRNSFVQLVNTGEVNDIIGIDTKTELGEISTSFNQLVANLRNEDKQKSKQLGLVSNALNTMQNQAHRINSTSISANVHVQTVYEIMQNLGQATDIVYELSQQVADNAKKTQQAMIESQQQVSQVLIASETTNNAALSGKNDIFELTQSVESVNSIIDVISAIAAQTNLLALNAAIEAARAGAHGKGFSVVADEVRQLASKTQDSIKQISDRLGQLQFASKRIEKTIIDIEQASNKQQSIAQLMKENAERVSEQANASVNVAQETLSQITNQREHYLAFENAMLQVNQQVTQSKELAETISFDVANQVKDINQTLKLAS